MCCIFTCCGWMIDLIQRLWTFTMSCCISSAVCCALVTASMSGIALGYNYSLAEYIDLKETNVSVYLKRGVFDDEIADDMDWRRSGHMPVAGHLKDTNLMTGAPENEEMPLRSGRRLDDSMVVSDDQHKFEGSLMRLTVRPPGDKSSAELVTSDAKLAEALEKYPSGSLDQMKAVHSLINQRRSNSQRNTVLTTTPKERLLDFNGRRMAGIAPGGVPMFGEVPYAEDPYKNINKARLAIPDQGIGEPAQWMLGDKSVPESYRRNILIEQGLDPMSSLAYPSRIHYTKDMPRPTRPKPEMKPTHTTMNTLLREQNAIIEGPDIERFRNKLIMDKFDMTRLNNNKEPYRQSSDDNILFNSEQDYEDQANKGLPIRKKRNVKKDNAHQPNTVFMNSMNGVRQIIDKNFLEKTLMGKLITRDKGKLL